MVEPLTIAVIAISVLLLVVAVGYAVRDRLIDNALLGVVGLLEVGLLVTLVAGLSDLGHIGDATERATFVAYLVSLPLIPVGTSFLAIKEKSRWAMGSIAVGAFAVAVMTSRLLQIWMSYG